MKIKLSLTALLLSSTFALAGGDISPVEPVVEVPSVVTPNLSKGFYAGLGYSCLQGMYDTPDSEFKAMSGISVNLGYDINKYFAVEARYSTSLGDVNYKTWNVDKDIKDSSISNIGVYLKPQFSVAGFGMYGLVGYGQTTMDDGKTSGKETGIQYGIGTDFTVMNVDMFVDYRRLYDAEDFDGTAKGQDVAVNSFTLGVNYKF